MFSSLFLIPLNTKTTCLYLVIFFFFSRPKQKFSLVQPYWGGGAEGESERSLTSGIPAPQAGEQRLHHTPSRTKTMGVSGGFCCYFEMVWGFLLCQKPCWGGNWRCIVETSIGAQEMTSLQELMDTVWEFALDFISKFSEESPRPESGVCLELYSAYGLIW